MKHAGLGTVVALMAIAGSSGLAQGSRVDLKKPLVIASQGSFFVGGEKKALPAPPAGRGGFGGGDVTVNQMYVQYQVPPNGTRHLPVVMVHGCCLSSKTWETTPDGRMGWDEYFVRRDRPVYLADQVSRARSGFDSSVISEVKAGTQPPSALPNIIYASQQIAWTVFRFGPAFGKTFPDGQFPIESVDELYKQMIPDFNALLPNPNPTWKNMAALAVQLKGAILMGHSESGFFPQQAALLDPSGIRGMISIEMPCPDLSAQQIATLAKSRTDATLTSPVAGIVTAKLADAGEVIAPRTPIVVVTDLDHAWANVYIDEPVVPRLKIGQKMTLLTDAGQRIDGTITFISPKAEFTPRNVQTAEERSRLVYRIKVTTDNRDGILKTGMPVEAEIPR